MEGSIYRVVSSVALDMANMFILEAHWIVEATEQTAAWLEAAKFARLCSRAAPAPPVVVTIGS